MSQDFNGILAHNKSINLLIQLNVQKSTSSDFVTFVD